MHGQFVRPLQAVSLGKRVVTQVKSTRCLGIELDSDLNWNVHVKELIKSFTETESSWVLVFFWRERIFILK